MLKKENNQLLFNTIISKSFITRLVTRQQRAQTEASVSNNIPLGSTHVTTTVSKSAVRYSSTKFQIEGNLYVHFTALPQYCLIC